MKMLSFLLQIKARVGGRWVIKEALKVPVVRELKWSSTNGLVNR